MGERVLSRELAQRIRLVLLDVDGVLSDGGIYLWTAPGGERVEGKRFNAQDGLGIKLMMGAGLDVIFVSGRYSAATELRAQELGIAECHQDPEARKLPAVQDILARRGLDWSEVAMMADDLADVPVFRRVGLPVAVANAVPEVAELAKVATSRPGGSGAVREFARTLLEARGQWDDVVEEYYRVRS
jgi:3-deoxy-D-manno-octulosonate 8-phosphate phosphatase (KDO 8-P phosphatase)